VDVRLRDPMGLAEENGRQAGWYRGSLCSRPGDGATAYAFPRFCRLVDPSASTTSCSGASDAPSRSSSRLRAAAMMGAP